MTLGICLIFDSLTAKIILISTNSILFTPCRTNQKAEFGHILLDCPNASEAILDMTSSNVSNVRIQRETLQTGYFVHFLLLLIRYRPKMLAKFSLFWSNCVIFMLGVKIRAITELIFATFLIKVLEGRALFAFFLSANRCSIQ